MQAVRDSMQDPAAAVKDYVAAVPQHTGKEKTIETILNRYVKDVYATTPASALGTFDPKRIKTVQDFYVSNKIIQSAVPVDDLYTNQFVS